MAGQGPLTRLRALLESEGLAGADFEDEVDAHAAAAAAALRQRLPRPARPGARLRSSSTSTPGRTRSSRRSAAALAAYVATFDEAEP